MTKRRAILEVVLARLQAIQTADGFATNAGSTVFLNDTPVLGDDDPNVAIAILVDEDAPGFRGENVHVALPINIQAHAKADLDEPWIAAEDVLGDIKKAMELADRTLGGLLASRLDRGPTRTVPRVEGMTTVGVSVGYTLPYSERWGQP